MQEQLQEMDIIRSVLQGDKARYAILVERYQSFVFTLVSRLIHSREEAEDVSQEVFVKAYLSLAGYKGNSKFSTWLYSITHTTAISHLRKNRVNTIFADDTQLAHYLENKVTGHAEIDIDKKDTRQIVNDAIRQLPPNDAEAITLFYLAEQSIEEIAAIMNIEVNNAKVKLHRARLKLKDIVERSYGNAQTLLYRN